MFAGPAAKVRIVGPRQRALTREFPRLQSHFLLQAHVCLVRRAQEKGQVECLVGYARRNTLVPVPSISGMESPTGRALPVILPVGVCFLAQAL